MVFSLGDYKMAKNFETDSLSHQTVSRRINDVKGEVSVLLGAFWIFFYFTL